MDEWANNRTIQILTVAEKGGYGILAQVCYDAPSVIGLVRSAERNNSPAILQLFPVTLAYGGAAFLQFCVTAAHGAKVPIAVHLDHATSTEHLELALGLAEQGIAFDSIMVDASHAETDEENIAECGEAGLRMIGGAKLTDPKKADAFMKGTGATILAPSIGNLHGTYLNPPTFNQDILRNLRKTFQGRGIPICLHGTDELPDELFRECVKSGVSKVCYRTRFFFLGLLIDKPRLNINSWARDPYVKQLIAGLSSKPVPDAIEEATEVFAKVCDRFIHLFGSNGKA